MKTRIRASSFAITLIASCIVCLLTAFMYRQMLERITLISANDNERILNALIAGLREHDDFGSVIESSDYLSERVAGAAVFMDEGTSLYSWGTAPVDFNFATLDKGFESGDRHVLAKPKTGMMTFIVRSSRMSPPPPGKPRPDEQRVDGQGMDRQPEVPHPGVSEMKPSFFFDVFVKGEWLYVDILHPDYWKARTAISIVFPIVAILLVILSFFMRHLVLSVLAYRDDIERQKNLVVLGTAASTLAHEIKNPLLAIRLQTGIIRKTHPGENIGELDNIDEEIARLTALAYRVNDFIREPSGTPSVVTPGMFTRIVALSACGKNAQVRDDSGNALVQIDPERLRSVLENIIRNALECGSDQETPEIRVFVRAESVIIEVLDRGEGLSIEAKKKLFEPFFTTKSRGTGIGLAVSRRFIQAAGGSIELENREGGGTIARIILPAYRGRA